MSNGAFIALMLRGAVFAVGLMTCHALHANDAPVRPPTTGVLADAARSHTYVGALTAGWRSLLDAHVPRVNLYLGMSDDDAPEPLRYAVAATTSQGRPIERADGSMVVASCRPGSCQEKGMVWASSDGVVVGALVHFYYKDPKAPMSPALLVWSRDVKASSLPHGFTMALEEWLRQPVSVAGFHAIRMVQPDGTIVDVSPAGLLP
nr:hypothetical protein [Luteibacter rhizovicinus]